jgi:hypothetical protein
MIRFIPYSREQQYLLPPSMDDRLPENHLARFIVEGQSSNWIYRSSRGGSPDVGRLRIIRQ